jgi:hypothetical protein
MSSTIPSAPHPQHTDVKPAKTRRHRVTDHRSAASPAVVSDAGPSAPQRESRMNLIAIRAHQIYEARGGQQGTAVEDWLQAEREIDAVPEPT